MTGDEFDLEALKDAVRHATPRPDPAARQANLRLAQENLARLQESRAGARPSSSRPPGGLWNGVSEMLKKLTGKGALTLTTALVAGGLLVGTPGGRSLWLPGPEVVRPAGSTRTEAATDPLPAAEATAQAESGDGPTPANVPTQAAGPEEAQVEAAQADRAQETAAPAAPAMPAPEAMAPPPPGDIVRTVTGGAMASGEAFNAQAYDGIGSYPLSENTESFANTAENPLQVTAENPVSTFSIDVDTASWSVVRQSLNWGSLPPPEAVRVEEMVNYFPYAYPAPEGEAAFRPAVTVLPTPWNGDTLLVEIGIQGRMPAIADRPPLNLVFLIDTSGSMDDPAKLPLLRAAFRLMLTQLRPEDRVAIVTYAGAAGIALEPTAAAETGTITAALDSLVPMGSTAGQAGLAQAYAVARRMADANSVTRVLLATDGDFNVGPSSVEELERFIADQRDSGVFLSVLGFGRGNLDDSIMQALAQNGNGTAAYIDTMAEAQKVLVDQLTGALFPIASDVKIQVEWNPATVAEYRLIGYETRALRREDFNNDRVDAGDLGAGHTVTAIYEITPVGSPAALVDPLRYGSGAEPGGPDDELGFLRLRWKAPGQGESALLETPIRPDDAGAPREDAEFAAAIAGFGQLLRGSDWTGDWSWQQAIDLAAASRGADPFGYRNEAVGLMRIAAALATGDGAAGTVPGTVPPAKQ
ncbi:MAG: VWA domain-containing protein [Rubellimicrobium sp.]|nr:VWA domain-containing protein [Rubellimicrobium sp.]